MSSTKVVGLLSSWECQKAKQVLQVSRHVSFELSTLLLVTQELSTDLPDHLLPPQYEPLMEFQWMEYVQDMKKVYNYNYLIIIFFSLHFPWPTIVQTHN